MFKYLEGFLFAEFLLLGQHVFECAPIAEFIDEVEVVGGFEHVVVPDYVRVRLNAAQDVDLVDRALLQFLILPELGDGDHLDGVLLLVGVVDGPVDLPVHARPYDLVQGVVLDVFDHRR